MKNAQTTFGGLAAAIGAALIAWSHGTLDGGSIGAVILALGSLYTGWKAQDAEMTK